MILVCTSDETMKYKLVGRFAIVENFSTVLYDKNYIGTLQQYIKALPPILPELRSVYWKITDYKNMRKKCSHISPVVKILSK